VLPSLSLVDLMQRYSNKKIVDNSVIRSCQNMFPARPIKSRFDKDIGALVFYTQLAHLAVVRSLSLTHSVMNHE